MGRVPKSQRFPTSAGNNSGSQKCHIGGLIAPSIFVIHLEKQVCPVITTRSGQITLRAKSIRSEFVIAITSELFLPESDYKSILIPDAPQ